MDIQKAHYIVVTGILVKDGKYLIAKRAPTEKAFPNQWTVPGGKLEAKDYLNKPKDTTQHWYNVLETVLKREIKEEVNLEITNICYVCSLVYMRSDNIPCLIISLYATPTTNNIILSKELTEYAYVTLEQAKSYNLVEGLFDELLMLDTFLKTGKHMVWKNKNRIHTLEHNQ